MTVPLVRMRLVVLLLTALLVSAPAGAQLQIGGHFTMLNLEYPDQVRSGLGAFAVYSPREWLGVDIGTSVFFDEPTGGAAWQLLAGPRAGVAVDRVGVFGRVRPGFVRFTRRFFAPDTVCILIFPPPETCLIDRTNLALDLGATAEVAATERLVLRFDVGDTLIRYPRARQDASWKHGFQLTAGAAWRF